MWNSTTIATDGESKRMACHKVVYLHQPYSTSTPTTSRSTMEPGALSTQTIYVSRSSTNHSSKFEETTEETIEEALDNLTIYYKMNSLNKDANRSLKVVWNEKELENTAYPKYLDVTLDRSLCYKQHIHNTKIKVATRNNPPTKLETSKWGENPSTIIMTALALSYSNG